MGWTFGKDFRKFAWKKNWGKKKKEYPIYEIPAPPDGKRDLEIEELLKSGKICEARELIELRIEEARDMPLGSKEKLKNPVHYLALINKQYTE